MEKKSISKKIATGVLSMMMVVSAVAYQGVVNAEPAPNTPTALSTPLAVDDTFTANIENNGVVNLPCTFKVTKAASGTTPGEVQVGKRGNTAISDSTTGTIRIPNTVSDGDNNTYTVTSLGEGAFYYCASLTSTGLESNTTVTSIGESAFDGCASLTSTGLESNTTVTNIGDSAFKLCLSLTSTGLAYNTTVTSLGREAFVACDSLTSTGLEKNTKVTDMGASTFFSCTNLTSTGLENNTTVTNIGWRAFSYCTSLGDVIFKITTLPTMDNSDGGIFGNTNANVYYLPETTNPEQLTGCGATAKALATDSIVVKTNPKDAYVASQSFDPTGLVLNVAYDQGVTRQVAYNDTTKANFSFDKTTLAMGDTAVKITYLGKEVSLPITVEAKVVTGIQVKNASTKVNYIEGQNFDPSGLVLTAAYNDGTSKDISYNDTTNADFSFDKTKLAVGDTGVTVTYKGQTVTMPITVVAKKVTEVKVETKATKDRYIDGESFNPKGLVLSTTYNDGTSKDISYNDTTKADFSFDKTVLAVGDTEVTITYMGQTTILPVTVEAKAVIDPTDPTTPIDPTKPGSNNEVIRNPIDGKIVTNDSTMDISQVIYVLLATGIVSIVLIKRKRSMTQ